MKTSKTILRPHENDKYRNGWHKLPKVGKWCAYPYRKGVYTTKCQSFSRPNIFWTQWLTWRMIFPHTRRLAL